MTHLAIGLLLALLGLLLVRTQPARTRYWQLGIALLGFGGATALGPLF